MKHKKSVLALALVVAMCLTILPASAQNAQPGAEEVIYAALSANGEVEHAYAVVAISAEGESVHYGEFSDVKNLSDTAPIDYENGKVSVDSGDARFYYQGEMSDVKLPWIVEIEYKLDGKTLSAEELAGKSGELEISMTTRKNPGVDEVFFKNYMMQVTVTLDASLCSEISAPGASVASAGGNKAIAFAILPGAEGDMSLTAKVKDFSMSGITLAAVPYDVSTALGDSESITDGLTQLTDAITQLSEGAEKLSSGAASLNSGASSYGGGIKELSGGSDQIVAGSEQIGSALGYIAGALSGQGGEAGGSIDLTALMQLPAGLRQAAAGLTQAADGIEQLAEGYAAAYPALAQAIAAIPAPSVTQEDIGALMALAPQNAALGALIANYEAAQTVRGVWEQTKAAFEAVNDNLPALGQAVDTVATSLEATADQIELGLASSGGSVDLSSLAALAGGISELNENYNSFHEGLIGYTGGVDQLAKNWDQLKSGISGISGGTAELSDGISQLDDETSAIPEQIEELLGSSDEESFKVKSFLDERNEDTESVQFVLTTAAIELPETESEPEPVEEDSSFFGAIWERFLALFN